MTVTATDAAGRPAPATAAADQHRHGQHPDTRINPSRAVRAFPGRDQADGWLRFLDAPRIPVSAWEDD